MEEKKVAYRALAALCCWLFDVAIFSLTLLCIAPFFKRRLRCKRRMHSLSITCCNGSTVITVAPCNEKSKYHHPLTRLLTLLSFHPRPPNEPLPKTALLQPSGSEPQPVVSVSRASLLPFNPSQKKFFVAPPARFASLPVSAREARAKRATTAFSGRKKIFLGVVFMVHPNF